MYCGLDIRYGIIYNRSMKRGDQMSSAIRKVMFYTRDYYTIILQVGIDKATEDWLIKAEYKRATKNNSCVFAVRVL